VERWCREARALGTELWHQYCQSVAILLPPNDGASWWADPHFANAMLLAVFTALLAVRFGAAATKAPRRMIHELHRDHRRRGSFRRRGTAIGDFAGARSTVEVRLASMVGLGTIKEHLLALLDTLEMDARRCASMPAFTSRRGCMHMTFVGNPGTGKTAVAQLVAELLKEMGVLRRGHLVVAKKDDLLGRYSNHVARNTRAVVQSALGGVLFIDEAYSLLQGEAELGREAVNVLVDMAYAHKNDLVIVLAGYTHTMTELFEANAGLASRFPYKFHFADYTAVELTVIAQRMLEAAVCWQQGGPGRLQADSSRRFLEISARCQRDVSEIPWKLH